MALRNYLSQKLFNWHAYPVQMDAQVTIGASGAPTLVTSSSAYSIPTSRGIKSITRLTTGIYQVQLDDNFSQLLDYAARFTAGQGGTVNMGSLSTGTVYQILTLGTSTQAQWVAAGLPVGVTAAVGQVFKAAGAGAGNGTTKLLVANAVSRIELMTNPSGADTMLNNQPFTQGLGGGYITFQCIASTSVGTVAAPVFTGSPLATHNHNLTVIGGQAAATTERIANYAGPILGKEAATDATYIGANSATNGGVVGASAGTPAGTNSAPAFTGTAAIAADPTNGSTMYLKFFLSNSRVG